ncbi:hypothetical protein, partial [Streptomyces sp. SID8380]|uniref:hypothetical protein n=1 Tax=Streptomyces sp. SID8380 TaxID=2690360 RepID=UPI002351A102
CGGGAEAGRGDRAAGRTGALVVRESYVSGGARRRTRARLAPDTPSRVLPQQYVHAGAVG